MAVEEEHHERPLGFNGSCRMPDDTTIPCFSRLLKKCAIAHEIQKMINTGL